MNRRLKVPLFYIFVYFNFYVEPRSGILFTRINSTETRNFVLTFIDLLKTNRL